MPAATHEARRAHATAASASPMAKRSSGWNVLWTHTQTGGRHARTTSVAGSHPRRPRPAARSNAIAPAMRTGQLTYAILSVAATARAGTDHLFMARNARSQLGPIALRGGNFTVCPIWAIAAMPPESSGYRGAVTLAPGGYAQASCPCEMAQVLKTDSYVSLLANPPSSATNPDKHGSGNTPTHGT